MTVPGGFTGHVFPCGTMPGGSSLRRHQKNQNQQNEQTTKDQPAKHNKDGNDDGDGVDSGYC